MRIKIIYDHLTQTGGSDYYLPCDITHYTKNVYYSVKYEEKLKKYIGKNIDRMDSGYCQDDYVQLYNGEKYNNIITNKNFKCLKSLLFKLETICKGEYCTCTHKRFDDLCFQNNQQISNIDFPNKSINGWDCKPSLNVYNRINNTFVNDDFIEIDVQSESPNHKDILIWEQSKGGNYISAPDNTIFYIDGTDIIIDEIKKINPNLKCEKLICSFKGANNTFRHIDELMCFMPYGIGKYKIWFYDEFTKNSFMIKYTDEQIDLFNRERLENLDLISMALFQSPFSECNDEFVFFNFCDWQVSILNRTWFETSRECICLFPQLCDDLPQGFNSTIHNIIDDKMRSEINLKTMEKLGIELQYIKSYINDMKPTFVNIIVKTPSLINPEGTVHCLIKQRFEKLKF